MRATLTIDEGRCVHRLAALAQCQACVRVCPRSAWTMNAKGLEFDESLCDGCGLCVAECPTGALAGTWPLPSVGGQRDGVSGVTLHCERATGTMPIGSTVPCVHIVDESQLLRWHAQGVGYLGTVTGHCESCDRRPPMGLDQRLERVNEALRARGRHTLQLGPGAVKPPIATRSSRPDAPPNRGRRGLLGLLGRTQHTDAPARPVSVPRCEANRRLAHCGPGPALWAVAFGANRCDACGACASLCPTGAIEMTLAGAGGAGEMALQMSLCIGCGVCVDACAPGALVRSACLGATGERMAWPLSLAPCPGCGRPLRGVRVDGKVPTARVCPACRSLAARRSDRIVQTHPEALPGGR